MIIFAVSIFVGTVVGLVLAIAVVIYFLRMLREVRPGVSPWGLHVFYNPLNVLFRPNLLDFILGTHPISTKGTTELGRSEATKRF
jgi:hypothetical protein